jgi:4-hydroxy-tetrahydrodipicolinate synthase
MQTPEDFIIYSGDDSLTLPMLSLGGYGVISVASHLVGKEIKQMITMFKQGNVEGSVQMQFKLYPLFKSLFTAPNPVPLKAALQEIGMLNERVRPPLVNLTDAEKSKLKAVLNTYQMVFN